MNTLTAYVVGAIAVLLVVNGVACVSDRTRVRANTIGLLSVGFLLGLLAMYVVTHSL